MLTCFGQVLFILQNYKSVCKQKLAFASSSVGIIDLEQ
jgi:hypothetical protein